MSIPIFITGNKNKLDEFKSILNIDIESKKYNAVEIQSIDVEDVTKHKVIEAYNYFKCPVIVEDTGLYIKKINNFPGALIKFYYDSIGEHQFCNIHSGQKIMAETVIGYHDGVNIHIFKGQIDGLVSPLPSGINGFGWDKIFIPSGYSKTFAQMSSQEKNNISMRKNALIKFKDFLNLKID